MVKVAKYQTYPLSTKYTDFVAIHVNFNTDAHFFQLELMLKFEELMTPE